MTLRRLCWFLLWTVAASAALQNAAPVDADVYVHDEVVTVSWTPASGSVDAYEVFVRHNDEPYPLQPDLVVVHDLESPRAAFPVRDGERVSVRVRALSVDHGPGPYSASSEWISVFLNGTEDDTDGDGLPNAWEEERGLDPCDPDTDDDGVRDAVEVFLEQDPLDPWDNRPRADAGPDVVLTQGTLVFLDGTESWDPNGDPLSYCWEQVSGTDVKILDPDAPVCGFFAGAPGSYGFELRVSDGKVVSPADTVHVTFMPWEGVPTADAGPDFVAPLAGPVVLDGTGSKDPNGMPLEFTWTQLEGPEVELETPAGPSPRFVPASTGTYVFRLEVHSDLATSEPDFVTADVVESLPLGDLLPRGDPDGTVDRWDLLAAYLLTFGFSDPTDLEFEILDLHPAKVLDAESEPPLVRLQPDGLLTAEDWYLLFGICAGIYRVVGWEDAPEAWIPEAAVVVEDPVEPEAAGGIWPAFRPGVPSATR